MRKFTIVLSSAAVAAVLVGAPLPALAQTTGQKAERKAERAAKDTGNTVTDSWITSKIKANFIGEDALEDSDINVDTNGGVVTLKGTVVAEAGRARAMAIARGTDGVKSVVDRLAIGREDADNDDADDNDNDQANDKHNDGVPGSDPWITTKVKSKFMGEDALDGSNINVDTDNGVVTLKGTVVAEAGRARAKAIAKNTDGVKSVVDRLTIGKADRSVAQKTENAVAETAETITDGWITTKLATKFVGEDPLEGSNINVDTNNGVVTLKGTVVTEAGRARAIAIAKDTDGVKSVVDRLTIARTKS